MCSLLVEKIHTPWSYKTLPEFSTAVTKLDKVGEEMFSEIRDLFIQFEEYQNFGLILLHKHFPLDDQELLVESINANIAVSIPWRKLSGKRST